VIHFLKSGGALVLLCTLFACSSDTPSRSFTTRGKMENVRQWGRDYIQAHARLSSQPVQGCAEMQNLATAAGVPVAALALVRWLEHCVADAGQAISALDQLHNDPAYTWLSPLLSELIVTMALDSQNLSALVKYSFARSKQLGSQREKEALLKAAIEAARALGLSAKIAEFEAELFRVAPRLKPHPTVNEWLKAADDARMNEEWDRALYLYEQIIAANRNPMEHFRALDGIRQAHKAKFRFYQGPLAAFMDSSKRTADFAEENVLRPGNLTFDERRILFEAWMQYSRDEWSYGDVAIAHREINKMLVLPDLDSPFRAYAYWTLSRIFANTGDWVASADAGEQAARLLERDLPNSASWSKWHWTLWDDALWAAALANRKNQDWTAASTLMDLALRFTQNPNSELKFNFWLAQSLKDQGITTAAETYLRKLMILDPHGFYGFLAHRELNQPLSPLPDLDLENISRPASISEQNFDVLTSLVYAGEMTLAQKYSQLLIPPQSVAIDELFLRAFVHDYSTILNLFFTRIPVADRNDFTSKYARLFYPEPFKNLVTAAVHRNPRIEKEYVYSIMRQESGFNPLSHSWANAYGLLQLLPQVARESQAKAGVTFQEDYELYLPEINIPLAVAHMDDLIDRAGESFILRTSSYNATVKKTMEWRQRLYSGSVYEFMEEIPFDETRSYVRLVMRNYIMNLRLNSNVPLQFPEELLNL